MGDIAAQAQDFSYAFLSIILEGAPFILLGTLVSGFIDVYLPAGTLEKFLPKRPARAVLVAGLLGLFLPVCECAIVPVIRRLVKKGLPFSAALTYMMAAPIVNPITALSTFAAFSGQRQVLMTSSRLIIGYLIAVAIGLILIRVSARRVLTAKVVDAIETEEHSHHHHHRHGPSKLTQAMRSALKDFVEVSVFFVIGVAAAAFFNVNNVFASDFMGTLAASLGGGPIVLMVMAFVISLCSTSDAFIAATLDRFSYGAKLAFMLFGPMMDVKLVFLYSTVLKKKAIAWLAAGLFVGIAVICITWQYVILNL